MRTLSRTLADSTKLQDVLIVVEAARKWFTGLQVVLTVCRFVSLRHHAKWIPASLLGAPPSAGHHSGVHEILRQEPGLHPHPRYGFGQGVSQKDRCMVHKQCLLQGAYERMFTIQTNLTFNSSQRPLVCRGENHVYLTDEP